MSAIFFVAPLLGFLSSCLVVSARRALRRGNQANPNSTMTGYGFQIKVFLIATPLFFICLPIVKTHSGIKALVQTANDYLLTFGLPSAATNIDYRTSRYSGLIDAADFDLSEQDFLSWMEVGYGKPTAFSAGQVEQSYGGIQKMQPVLVEPVSAMLSSHYEELLIESGFYFDDYDHDRYDDSGITIIFDSSNQRVYVRQTLF